MQNPQQYAVQLQPQYVVQPQYAPHPQVQVHPSMQGQLQLPNTPSIQNMQAKPPSGEGNAARGCVACVGVTLLVMTLYAAWPSDQGIEVRTNGLNVTDMCLPSESSPCRFTFEMDVPLEVTSSNYFEHPATVGIDVSYTGLASFGNLGGLTSPCPCPIASGSWEGVLESRPVLSVPRSFPVPVSVHAVDTTSLVSQAYSDAMFKELASDCADEEGIFEIQVSGWLNYSSVLISNQRFEAPPIELACSRQMLDAINVAAGDEDGRHSASPWLSPAATMLVLAAATALCLR